MVAGTARGATLAPTPPDPDAAAGGSSVPASSQTETTPTATPTPLANGSTSSLVGGAALPTSGPGGAAPSTFADYKWKGININLPGPEDTLDPDPAGLRQTLADEGLSYQGFASGTFYGNVLHSERNNGNRQQYNGQKSTGFSQNFLIITYDLSRYGIPDGQLAAGAAVGSTSWNQLGPNYAHVSTLSYYQTFFHKLLEFKIGLLTDTFEYGGPYAGGNIAGGVFGVSGNLFFQAGLPSLSQPTYGSNLTIHPTRHFYDKFGIARSVDPDGPIDETEINPQGFRGSVANASALVVNELGYLRSSTPDEDKIWVRAGGIYNWSHFVNYEYDDRTSGNYMLYLLADKQLTQTASERDQAYRGLYVGISVEDAPPDMNRFSEYYEFRLYGLGLLPGRPHDQISLIANDTYFSKVLVDQANAAGQHTHKDSKTLTAAYSASVIHGLFLNAGLTYINNPTSVTYKSNTGSALDLIAGISVYF